MNLPIPEATYIDATQYSTPEEFGAAYKALTKRLIVKKSISVPITPNMTNIQRKELMKLIKAEAIK
jgi:hypothetical protein